MGLEHLVRPARRLGLVRLHVTQREPDVDPAQHQDALLGLYLTPGQRREGPFVGLDPARLQRATQGAEQSAAGSGHHVVEGCGVRVRDLALDPVVPGDRAMGAEAYGPGLGGQVGQAQRAAFPGEADSEV